MPTAEMQEKQEAPAPSGIATRSDSDVGPSASPQSAWRRVGGKIKRLPRWAHIAFLSLVLLISLVLVYTFYPSGPADLRLTVQHGFRSVQVSVLLDGKVIYKGAVNGTSRKRFGLFDKNGSGPFSKVLHVPSGKHAVQVHVNAPGEGFDQAKVAYAEFAEEQENVLVIGAGRRAGLSLAFQGGAVAKAAAMESDSKPNRSAFSVLFSVIGTMFSASISFLVQEFWRSHKNRVASSPSGK